MTARMFRVSTLVLAVIIAGILAWTVTTDMPMWIALAVIIIAMMVKLVMRKKTTEILVDERQRQIGNRAATISFRVFGITFAVFEILIIAFKASLPSEFEIIGTTLAFAVGTMMVIYLISYYILAARS